MLFFACYSFGNRQLEHDKTNIVDISEYYITPPHDCSYLENKSARMVFLDPIHRIDVVTLFSMLFFACYSFGNRQLEHDKTNIVDISDIQGDKQSRHYGESLNKRNQDLTMTVLPTRQAAQIHYDLYERYINERHADKTNIVDISDIQGDKQSRHYGESLNEKVLKE
jgi:arginyl-tRNA--protein-N-Asp/Glu arginylyltransferase